MSIYCFVFEVEGDAVARHWSLIKTVDADSLAEAVELTWEGYKSALRWLWKTPCEAAIYFEPRPNKLLTINARRDDDILNEDEVLDAFFKKRIEEFRDNMPNWSTIYSQENSS